MNKADLVSLTNLAGIDTSNDSRHATLSQQLREFLGQHGYTGKVTKRDEVERFIRGVNVHKEARREQILRKQIAKEKSKRQITSEAIQSVINQRKQKADVILRKQIEEEKSKRTITQQSIQEAISKRQSSLSPKQATDPISPKTRLHRLKEMIEAENIRPGMRVTYTPI